MAVTGVSHDIASSYKGTFFLIRDQIHPSVLYISDLYKDTQPLLLVFTAILAMASGALPDAVPRIPSDEVGRHLKRIEEQAALQSEYGIVTR
jgi:hypothetical protein